MKNTWKRAAATICTAVMVMSASMGVHANTLVSATPSGDVDTITVQVKVDSSGDYFSLYPDDVNAYKDVHASGDYFYDDAGNVESYSTILNNYGAKDYSINLMKYQFAKNEDGSYKTLTTSDGTTLYLYSNTVILARYNLSGKGAGPVAHDHSYVPDAIPVYYAASENSDAVKAYQCPHCGQIISAATVYGTAFNAFNDKVASVITDAPANTEVVVSTKRFDTINAEVLDAITARPDVTVKLDYIRKGYGWTEITIPAGTDVSGLKNEEGFAGFEYLIANFGCTPIE